MVDASVAAVAVIFQDGLNALGVEGDGTGGGLGLSRDAAWLPKGRGSCEREGDERESGDVAGNAEAVEPISGRLVAGHALCLRGAFDGT